MACFFYIVLIPISTTSGLWSTSNTRKYHQIHVYIYQCDLPILMSSYCLLDEALEIYAKGVWDGGILEGNYF